MSVVWFQETGKEDERISQGFVREYTRYFQCLVTSYSDGWPTMLRYRPDLAPYQPHPRDPLAVVRGFTPTRKEGTLLWDIEVEYSSEQEEEEDENPLARRARIEWDDAQFQRPPYTDINGRLITNTAGDLIQDAPDVDDSRWVLSVTKNVARVPKWLTTYRNAINNNPITIRGLPFAQETLKLQGLHIGDEEVENRIRFYPLSFQLHFKEIGWQPLLRNTGMNELYTVEVPVDPKKPDGKKKKVTRKRPILIEGKPPATPQFLDEDGAWIQPPEDGAKETMAEKLQRLGVVIKVPYYPLRDFSKLPLK